MKIVFFISSFLFLIGCSENKNSNISDFDQIIVNRLIITDLLIKDQIRSAASEFVDITLQSSSLEKSKGEVKVTRNYIVSNLEISQLLLLKNTLAQALLAKFEDDASIILGEKYALIEIKDVSINVNKKLLIVKFALKRLVKK